MTSIRVGLGKRRNGLKVEVEEVMANLKVYRITIPTVSSLSDNELTAGVFRKKRSVLKSVNNVKCATKAVSERKFH